MTPFHQKKYLKAPVLKIDIRSLEIGSNEIELAIGREEVGTVLAAPMVEDGKALLTLYHSKVETVVTIFISVKVDLECARCLDPFEMEITSDLTVILKRGMAGTVSEEGEVPVLFYDAADPVVDLATIVSEEIAVSIPMQPICNEECEGLCPKCGENLNENRCSCR